MATAGRRGGVAGRSTSWEPRGALDTSRPARAASGVGRTAAQAGRVIGRASAPAVLVDGQLVGVVGQLDGDPDPTSADAEHAVTSGLGTPGCSLPGRPDALP